MSQKSRQEALEKLRWHYARATSRQNKSELIAAWCRLSGHERKYAIKELRGQRGPGVAPQAAPRTRRGRGGSQAKYGPAVRAILKELWKLAEQPCGKRLKAVVELWLPSWERRHGELEALTREGLLKISPRQIDRVLASSKVRGRKGPAPGCQVRAQVPLRTGPWEVSTPGWVEVDSVAHCGGNMGGSFAWSVCMSDIHTGWTEVRASWNRSDRAVHACLQQCEESLPFAMVGYDSDNGGEVLNTTVGRWLKERERPVEQTRSRPYHKNDNAHVEQKNLTHVRLLLGWERIGHIEQMEVLGELLKKWSLWNNLYSPTLKLQSKERQGARLIKRHEKEARTPAQRVLRSCGANSPSALVVQQWLWQHDPIEMKQQIEVLLREFHRQGRDLDVAACQAAHPHHESLRAAGPPSARLRLADSGPAARSESPPLNHNPIN